MLKNMKKVGGFSVGTLLSRLTGLAREVVFAYLFGSSASMDALRVAFNVPNLLRDFFGEGGMNAAFLPVFSDYRTKYGKKQANIYFTSFLIPLCLILIILVTIGIIFAPEIISLVARGFIKNPGQFNLAVKLTRILFPFLFFISITAVFMGILTYFDRFFISGVNPVLFNISVILFSFFLYSKFGVTGAAIGMVSGGLLQALFLLVFLPSEGIKVRKPCLPHPGVVKSIKLIGPVFLAYAATRINVTVTLFLASLLPEGSISHLTYAYRVMQLPLGMFGVAVSVVALPELSRKVSLGESQDSSINRSLRTLFILIIPVSFLLFALRLPVVKILYERGAFLTKDSISTASILAFYTIGIPFIAANKVIRNVYFSRKDVRTPMKISFLILVINVLMAVIFMVKYGVKGLALAVSASAVVHFFMLTRPFMTQLKRVLILLLKLILSSLISFIPVIYIREIFNPVISIIVGGASFGLIFMVIAYILKVKEIWMLLKKRNVQ